MKPKYALSIKQPGASLVVWGVKDIENRQDPIPEEITLPCEIYIHTGKKIDDNEYSWKFIWDRIDNQVKEALYDQEHIKGFPSGAIIGRATIIECVEEHSSRWFTGPYGYVLKNASYYKRPIKYPGKLGFFEVEI